MRLAVIVFLAFGLGANVAAWSSLDPVAMGFICYLIGMAAACNFPAWRESLSLYTITYSIYWAATGVSALYLKFGDDASQLYGDAQHFFKVSTGLEGSYPLTDIFNLSEGALAIKIWHTVYEFTKILDFPIERYIGVNVNVLITTLAAVLSMQTLRRVTPSSPKKTRILLLLLAFCPMFWLSASIHVRDSFAMFLVSVNYYVLVSSMSRPANFLWLGIAISATAILPFFFQITRAELYYAPPALAAAAVVSSTVFRGYRRSGYLKYITLMLPVFFLLLTLGAFEMIGAESITKGRDDYAGKAIATGVERSLGYKFVVDQPIYVRPFVGIFYLLLMPVPVWAGFGIGTAYMTFKTLFAVFNYFFLPYFAVAAGGFSTLQGFQRVSFVFLLGSAAAFSIAVALSSLESRHIIPFLPPLFIACAMMADYVESRWRQWRLYTQILLVLVVAVHAAWFMLKF